jgi:small subunit ribosomal protein S5
MRRGRVVLTSESSNTRGGSRDGGRGGNQRGGNNRGGNRGGNNRRQEAERSTDPFEEKMISLERNAKTYQGGRRFKFQAVVVVGDRNGRVGLGIGKSREVPLAVAKANANARKNLIGVIAGGVPRAIAELAGITDLLSKELGSRTKVNVAYAVFDGLRRLQTREGLAKLKESAQ